MYAFQLNLYIVRVLLLFTMRILYRVSKVSFSIGVEIVATMGVKMDLVFILK